MRTPYLAKALGGIALAVATLMPTLAAAQSAVKIGYLTARNSHLGDGATAFCDVIEKDTQGRYKCTHGPSGAYGGEKDMVEALKNGSLQVAHLTTGTLAAIAPSVGMFDIPFLFRDYAHARKVLDGQIGQQVLNEGFAESNVVALAWSENGFRHLTNNVRPITAPDDLKGLKLRTMENKVHLMSFKALGAEPKPLPFPQLFEALQTGAFDGEENPISIITAAKFAQVQKHLTLSGHVYSAAMALVSPKFWNSLSAEDKKVFEKAGKALTKATRDRVSKDDKEGLEALKAQGMQIVPSIDRAAFSNAMKTARTELEGQFGKDKITAIAAVR